MLGVYLWEVTTFGQRPWQNVRNADYPMLLAVGARLPRPDPLGVGCSTCPLSLYSLMLQCWADQPSDRPECDQIFNQLLKIRDESIEEQRTGSKQQLEQKIIPVVAKTSPTNHQEGSKSSSSTSLALEQATLWLLDSVATLAPSSLSPLGQQLTKKPQVAPKPQFNDVRHHFSTMTNPSKNARFLTGGHSNSFSSTNRPFVVPIIQTGQSSRTLMSSNNSLNATSLGNGLSKTLDRKKLSESHSAISPSGDSRGVAPENQQLYDSTLSVVRSVFTLNKELEKVGTETSPNSLQVIELASTVCAAGRNLLTVASEV